MLVEETEFKGRPTITIKFDENDKYPFSFGIGKAKKILGSLDEIRAFFEKHDKPREEPPQMQPETQEEPEPMPEPESEPQPAPEPEKSPEPENPETPQEDNNTPE